MASQETIRYSEPARASFFNDPKIRGIFYQVVVFIGARRLRLVDRRQHDREPAARQHRVRFRLPQGPRRLRHQPEPDRLLRRTRPSAAPARRPAEHAARRRRRHRHRLDHRLPGRHRPAVEELADPQDLDRLRRDVPQHPAAAGHLLLVSRRAVGAAAAARQLSICRSAPISTTAASSAEAWSGARARG